MERMATIERDPFANTADADAYVPRTATESVLVRLEMALRDGARVVCLGGRAGSGKTLLLRVLEERLAEDFASVRVQYSKLDPDEFCRWGLDALGEAAAEDPERALAARIARGVAAGDPPLVWMIDDADLLPIPTLRMLLQLQRSTGGALRLLLARSGELPADEFASAGVMPVNVELGGEMDSAEMARYVRARLERAGANPDQRAQIEGALDQLYARSHGNPGRLHAAAAALLCFGPGRFCAPVEREEPIEEEPAPPAEARGEVPAAAEIAVNATAHAVEVAVESSTFERVSIESLVAEAVASEPLEESAIPVPASTTALVVPVVSAPDSPASASPPDGQSPRAPRKRHRLRRLGRR